MRYVPKRILLNSFATAAMVLAAFPLSALAQIAPSKAEIAAYTGLHRAAHDGNAERIGALVKRGANLEARDKFARTAVHVATYAGQATALRALAKAGANMNALERQAYDAVTIASVANNVKILDLVLKLGNKATNRTSPYHGTALIAAAHLGHHQVVKRLIKAGAPLDHVNNLGWTALMESVVLGDGGKNHVECARALIKAGANRNIADRQGVTPLAHARARGYSEMVRVLSAK